MQGHAGMESKMQFCDTMDIAYAKFVDMKSSGRWELIKKYFKPSTEQDEDNVNFSMINGVSRSIIKKKSMLETTQIQ